MKDEIIIKNFMVEKAEEVRQELENLCSYIFNNPELAFKEYKAHEALTKYLAEKGFDVKTGIADLETSFEATFDSGKNGKKIAFLAEYDCLPEIGHGCGHNIIGVSSVGAGIVLKSAMEKFGIAGTVKVIGTPGEERVGGKCIMVEKGIFKSIDAALIMHPTNASIPDDISFAAVNLEYHFTGKPAHAAAFPWVGANALSGVIQMFNSVDAMRLHFKDYSRVHGIITNGGAAHNTISDKASALFNVRALDYDYLMELVKHIENCAKGAAISTGTEVEIKQIDYVLKNVKNDKTLVKYARENMEFIGEDYIERDLSQGIGSTDMGNVTHEIPGIQFYINLQNDVATHTQGFADAAGSKAGKRTLLAATKVLALSGFDILNNN